MSKTKEQAIEKLRDALPYFRKAVADAKKQGNVQLGVMATNPDGSGQVLMRFDSEDFFEDLALVLDLGPQTEEDDRKASALAFLQNHNIAGPGH